MDLAIPEAKDLYDCIRAVSKRRDIKRLYVYNWTGANCNGFDTGLTRADGSLRPAYSTFKSRLSGFNSTRIGRRPCSSGSRSDGFAM